jgi:radical SAM protein with 4Fe4S-binding SPASM domain
MNHTVHGYKELLNLCDRLDGLPQFDFHISPATDGDQSCTEHQVLDPDILALMFREPRTSLYVDLTLPNHGRVRRAMNDAVCGGGHTSLSICPDGTVYPCNSFPIPLGNIRNDGIRKVWESSEELVAWKKTVWNDFNECGLYADCAYCSFCPGMSLLETGNLFGKAKTCCTTAKVRRTVALDLRNGKDPLVDYVNHTQPFGMDTTFQLPKKSFKGVMRQFCAQSKITKNHLENLQQLAATAGVDLVDFDKVYQGCEDAVSQSQFISQESGVIEQVPFLQRYMEIQQHGNNVRKTIVPESDSPVEENLTKEMLVGSARFFESGR